MILVVAAMEEEVNLLIENLSNKETFNKKGYILHLGKLDNKKIAVLVSGIGKVQSAFAVTDALNNINIDLILNVGFSGGTKPYNINDIVIVNEARYHDFDLTLFGYEYGQVPKQPPFYSSNQNIVNLLISKNSLYKKGILFTGDIFLTRELDLKEGYMVDMEGTALFHVANNLGIKMVSIKIISDLIGISDFDEYKEFEKNNGKKEMLKIVRDIMGVI